MADGPESPRPGWDSTGDPVRDYVRANLQTMTREAIRDRLVAAGHDPARVDDVREQEWTGFAPAATDRALWTTALILFVCGGVVGAAGALLLTTFVSDHGGSAALFLGLYAVAYVLSGLAIAIAVRSAARAWRISGGWAVVIGVVMVPVYAVLMYGTCVAAESLSSG
jgi:hypothetical protein